MYKIGFIILNYCTLKETKSCVESIFSKIDTQNFEIIIVDNNSPDRSGIALNSAFENTEKVSIILNEENIGFARGNNKGIFHAKYSLKCDFIVTLNSDTYLVQNDFSELIFKEFEKSSFAVLGPRVITREHQYCENPGRNTVMTIAEISKYIMKVQVRLFFNYLHIEKLYGKLLKFLNDLIMKNTAYEKANRKHRHENVQLHGCCLVFSPEFISRFDGFNDQTFLYREEEILFTTMMLENLKTVYNPSIKIFHEEDAAINSISTKSIYKMRFMYKHLIKSSRVLKGVLLNYYSSKKAL